MVYLKIISDDDIFEINLDFNVNDLVLLMENNFDEVREGTLLRTSKIDKTLYSFLMRMNTLSPLWIYLI